MMLWKQYLTNTQETKFNVTQLNSMAELSPSCVAEYVYRCLDIAEKDMRVFDSLSRKLVTRTLQWMDVAKCGSEADRQRWKALYPNICLDAHTEASAVIYAAEGAVEDDKKTRDIVSALIRTHGLVGQYLMGECDLRAYTSLDNLDIDKQSLFKVLKVLNHAVMAGVSEELWNKNKVKVNALLTGIVNGLYKSENTFTRLQKLFPAFASVKHLTPYEQSLYDNIFQHAMLWYPTAALQSFSRIELNTIFSMIQATGLEGVEHIDFYNLLKELSYDRRGFVTLNIYKKRILEVLLRGMVEGQDSNCEKEHVQIGCERDANCIRFVVRFTPVCEALINFCVEAERSGFANYQKNIITIFDMFGFRRDVFDRLTNEEDYLEAMNNSKESSKLSILNFVHGENVLDVGSGGGILLDELEWRYPDKNIMGTDISANVIEVLQNKIREEDHQYQVFEHNFVYQRLWTPVDTIIFSSIIHEIYSYTELHGTKFNMDSVKQALDNAKHSLVQGGRIIIRDGIKTDSNRVVSVKFKDSDMFMLAQNFLKDFKGLRELRNDHGEWRDVVIDKNVISGNINLIREMLYTITWGPMSYPQEVQEQFGYLTFREYIQMLEELGYTIYAADEFLEPGYPEHLNSKVELLDFEWSHIPSNCIIIAEKL